MEQLGDLMSSARVLPMGKGLYLFTVRSSHPRRIGDGKTIVVPAFRVGPAPGTLGEDFEILSGSHTESGWLCDHRHEVFLRVKAQSAMLLLTSLRTPDAAPLEIDVKRLEDPGWESAAAAQAERGALASRNGALPPARSGAIGRSGTAGDGSPALLKSDLAKSDPSGGNQLPSGPATAIDHPAWRRARQRILAAAGAAPATMALLGAGGTGKTWLLNDVAVALRQQGCSVTLTRRGDAPFDIANGKIVLVDEAALMDRETLASMAEQRAGLVILAALPEFSSRLAALPRPPEAIHLAPLAPGDVRPFLAKWLERSSIPSALVTDDAVARLIAHTGAVPRVLVQTLSYALSIAGASGRTVIKGIDVDEAAELRLASLNMDPPARNAPALAPPRPVDVASPAPSPMPPSLLQTAPAPGDRSRAGAVPYAIAAAIGLVACIAAGTYFAMPKSGSATLRPSETDPGAPSSTAFPPRAGPEPRPDAPEPPPIIAAASPPSLPQPPAAKPAMSPVAPPASGGSPGLMLVAKAGDTLPALYARVYRGLRPPPYAEVAAANPAPVSPGEVLVFPAPPSGWSR